MPSSARAKRRDIPFLTLFHNMAITETPEVTAPRSRATRSRILSNSAFSLVAYALYVPIFFFLSRFIVHHLGLATYGIWATFSAVMGLGGLLGFGVPAPLVKYAAEFMALGRTRDVNVLVNTAMVFFFAMSAVFVIVMTLATNWILTHLFHVGNDPALRQLYWAYLFGWGIVTTFSGMQALLSGAQRSDIYNILFLACGLVYAVSVIIMIGLGWGLNALVVSWLIQEFLIVALSWIAAKIIFRPLQLNPFLFSWPLLKRILGFGAKVQVSNIMYTLNDQVDRSLIAYALGPALLGAYALASQPVRVVRQMSHYAVTAVLSSASDLSVTGQHDRVLALVVRGTRYLSIVVFAFCTGVAGLAIPLVFLWLGNGYWRVAVTIMVVLAGTAVWLPTQAITEALNGLEKPEVRMRGDLAFLAMHLPVAAFLIWKFGYFGSLTGTAIVLSVTRFYIYWAGSRALGLRLSDLFRRSFLQPAIAALLALAAVVSLQVAGAPISPIMALIELVIFGAIFAGYAWALAFDNYDRNLVRGYVFRPARRVAGRLIPGMAGAR